jgi:hypothetical protein
MNEEVSCGLILVFPDTRPSERGVINETGCLISRPYQGGQDSHTAACQTRGMWQLASSRSRCACDEGSERCHLWPVKLFHMTKVNSVVLAREELYRQSDRRLAAKLVPTQQILTTVFSDF